MVILCTQMVICSKDMDRSDTWYSRSQTGTVTRSLFDAASSRYCMPPPRHTDNNGSYLLRGMKASVFLRELSNRILLVIRKCRHYFWTFTGSLRLTLVLLFIALKAFYPRGQNIPLFLLSASFNYGSGIGLQNRKEVVPSTSNKFSGRFLKYVSEWEVTDLFIPSVLAMP